MNEYVIFGGKLDKVDFAPTTAALEILQNVRTIITTSKYTVPLDREFGLSGNFLDAPTQKAMAALRSEIIQAVRKYEPRAIVKRVDFDESTVIDGVLHPRVVVAIND